MAVPRKLACGVNSRPTFAKSSHVEGARGAWLPLRQIQPCCRRGACSASSVSVRTEGRVQFVWNLNDARRKLRALPWLRQ
jgi:hypothetical protein